MGYAKLIVRDKHSNTSFKDQNYNNKNAVENLIHYVFKDNTGDRQVRLYGGLGIDLITSERAVKQMKKIKKLYKKLDRRQMYHFILSFDDRIKNPVAVYEIGMGIMDTFFYGYQIVFTVHENTDKLHLHFIFNSVNMLNGYKWHMNGMEFKEFKKNIEDYADACLKQEGYDFSWTDYKVATMEELVE
ncbi:MAG: relaxase/mobilization nuclease domain-containing protein [Lachnospiraceae bacterium]|nr:relaxase/mobilization nuclease domain-containing protein [Lachnospiraceae bacterium]